MTRSRRSSCRILTGRGTLSKIFTPFYNVWNKTETAPGGGYVSSLTSQSI